MGKIQRLTYFLNLVAVNADGVRMVLGLGLGGPEGWLTGSRKKKVKIPVLVAA